MYQRPFGTVMAVIITAAVVILFSSSLKAADGVVKANATGYIKITISSGGFVPQQYQSAGETHVLSDLTLTTGSDLVQTAIGSTENNVVSAALTGTYSNDTSSGPFLLEGSIEMDVLNKAGNTTGTFQTEIVSMSLTGNVVPSGLPWVMTESASQSSLGQTSITDLGGGLYSIGSFFDVFTELSIDGGASSVGQTNAPTRFTLIPEPTALALMGLAGLALLRRRITQHE